MLQIGIPFLFLKDPIYQHIITSGLLEWIPFKNVSMLIPFCKIQVWL